MLKADDIPIGEVNIHFDKEYNKNFIGIIIHADYQGKGYAEKALRLKKLALKEMEMIC